MKNWIEFNESLPPYNPYSESKQKEKKCPECGETTKIKLLGPGDYSRDISGNYNRILVYKCENCKHVFNVE